MQYFVLSFCFCDKIIRFAIFLFLKCTYIMQYFKQFIMQMFCLCVCQAIQFLFMNKVLMQVWLVFPSNTPDAFVACLHPPQLHVPLLWKLHRLQLCTKNRFMQYIMSSYLTNNLLKFYVAATRQKKYLFKKNYLFKNIDFYLKNGPF